MSGNLTSNDLVQIDPKGRLPLPARFRNSLSQDSDSRLVYIGDYQHAPCLNGMSEARVKKLQLMLQQKEELANAEGREFRMDIEGANFARLNDYKYDGSGRLVLDSFHMSKANLTDRAFIFGSGLEFYIWDPVTFLASTDPAHAYLREVCAHHMKQAGVPI